MESKHNGPSEPMNQWVNESMNQWTNESTNQWINESINQWINESMIQWINESMNPWTNEWRNGRRDEWMDGRAIFLCWAILLYFFSERPLRWGTSSLSYFFSERPLIWATSALSCLPASSFVGSAAQFFSSRRFSNFQLQSRLPGASQHHACFAAHSCANALRFVIAGCKPAKQERCTKSTNVGAASTVRTIQHCSERLNSFNILNRKSSSRHSPVRFLSTTFPNPRKQTPYFGEQYIKDVS